MKFRCFEQRLGFIALFLSWVLLVAFAAGCSNPTRTSKSIPNAPSVPVVVGEGLTLHLPADADGRAPTVLVDYDKKMYARIQERWRQEMRYRKVKDSGLVIVDFILKADGEVSEVRVSETVLAGPAVEACERAVLMSAPFNPWPWEMRSLIGKDYREVRFRFRYGDN